jgi:hypothetical protein
MLSLVAVVLLFGASGCAAKSGDGGAAPTVCTSGTFTLGEMVPDTNLMHPGGACNACHATAERRAPIFSVSGTVYPTLHEKDDCNADSSVEGTRVVITGANGQMLMIVVNATGNFLSLEPVAFPFSAKVVHNGNERAMGAHQSTGDCNSCHTEQGASGAPGRIMAP